MMNKNKILLVGLFILLILCTVSPRYNEMLFLEDADVNTENGDACIAYYNEDTKLVVVETFDLSGVRIYTKEFDSKTGNVVRVRYIDGFLNVFIPHTREQYIFDRAGNEIRYIKKPISTEIISTDRLETFSGGKNKSYKLNEREYCYEKSSFLSAFVGVGYVKFYIKEPDGNLIMLYEDSI